MLRSSTSAAVRVAILTVLAVTCLSASAEVERQPMLGAAEGPVADRFSFIVHGDLTGGERAGIFDVAVEQMKLLQPEFVISVGDLIEGDVDEAAALHAEWDSYEKRVANAGVPVYLVAGNHDIVSPRQSRVWRERYGSTYYHFRHRDVLFLVLDTEDHTAEQRAAITRERDAANRIAQEQGWGAFGETEFANKPERTSGVVSPAQAAYFQNVLATHGDVRWTFVFIHKAAWENEAGSGFDAIEKALSGRPYTVFHGHEHAQHLAERNGNQYIRLGTTGGVQLHQKGRAVDHLTLVTVGDRVSIATLDLAGIRDPAGELPGDGADLCFDVLRCEQD